MGVVLRLVNIIDFAARVASMVFVLAILGVMSAQVVFRYVLNSSLQWSEELSIWIMIWMIFIGSVVVIRGWNHVNIPTAIRALPVVLRPVPIIASKVAVLLFLAAITWYGIAVFNGSANAFSHNLGLSNKWAKLSIPVGGALMGVMVVAQILEDVVRLLGRDWDYFERYGSLEPE